MICLKTDTVDHASIGKAGFGLSRYSIKKLLLYGSIYILLGLSNLLIKLVSFKKLVRLFSNSDTIAQSVLPPEKMARLCLIRNAIVSVSRRTPWRSKCFEQAITASLLLKLLRVSYSICFGLNNENNELKAHAWLLVNDFYLTGYDVNMDFTAVSTFNYVSKKDRVQYV